MVDDSVLCIDISPNFSSNGVCFAGKRSGLYRSNDGGKTWQSAYKSLNTSLAIPTLAVRMSPFFEQDRMILAATEGGIFISNDGSQSWQFRVLDNPAPLPIAIEYSPVFDKDGAIIVTTLNDGVFISTDFGNTWAAWNYGLFDLRTNCLAVSPEFEKDRSIYVGTESGLYISLNGGKSWLEVADFNLSASITDLVFSSQKRGMLLAVVDNSNLFALADSGTSCIPIEPLPAGNIERVHFVNIGSSTIIVALISDAVWVLGDFTFSPYLYYQSTQRITCLCVSQSQYISLLLGLVTGEILRIELNTNQIPFICLEDDQS